MALGKCPQGRLARKLPLPAAQAKMARGARAGASAEGRPSHPGCADSSCRRFRWGLFRAHSTRPSSGARGAAAPRPAPSRGRCQHADPSRRPLPALPSGGADANAGGGLSTRIDFVWFAFVFNRHFRSKTPNPRRVWGGESKPLHSSQKQSPLETEPQGALSGRGRIGAGPRGEKRPQHLPHGAPRGSRSGSGPGSGPGGRCAERPRRPTCSPCPLELGGRRRRHNREFMAWVTCSLSHNGAR